MNSSQIQFDKSWRLFSENHTSLQQNQYLNAVSVQSTGYKFIQLKWNAAKATLPVFYIVFGHASGSSQPTKALQIVSECYDDL